VAAVNIIQELVKHVLKIWVVAEVQVLNEVNLAWLMQVAPLVSMTKVVLAHLAKFMKMENFHKLELQAVVKFNRSLVTTTAVVTTCLVSVDNSQLVAEKIQSVFPVVK
jgi:hypothetical protein